MTVISTVSSMRGEGMLIGAQEFGQKGFACCVGLWVGLVGGDGDEGSIWRGFSARCPKIIHLKSHAASRLKGITQDSVMTLSWRATLTGS